MNIVKTLSPLFFVPGSGSGFILILFRIQRNLKTESGSGSKAGKDTGSGSETLPPPSAITMKINYISN